MLFAVVPFRSLDAGPEFFNSLTAPHNCIGGSENGCLPGAAEAAYMFQDPSKMAKPVRDQKILSLVLVQYYSLFAFLLFSLFLSLYSVALYFIDDLLSLYSSASPSPRAGTRTRPPSSSKHT